MFYRHLSTFLTKRAVGLVNNSAYGIPLLVFGIAVFVIFVVISAITGRNR